MNRLARPALALASLAVMACTASSRAALYGQEEIVVLEVAPQRVACVGEMRDMCLQVRSPGEEVWKKFYDTIEGFEHEEGVTYTLEVGRRKILNPPADGSSYAWRLIRILEEAPAGS